MKEDNRNLNALYEETGTDVPVEPEANPWLSVT